MSVRARPQSLSRVHVTACREFSEAAALMEARREELLVRRAMNLVGKMAQAQEGVAQSSVEQEMAMASTGRSRTPSSLPRSLSSPIAAHASWGGGLLASWRSEGSTAFGETVAPLVGEVGAQVMSTNAKGQQCSSKGCATAVVPDLIAGAV